MPDGEKKIEEVKVGDLVLGGSGCGGTCFRAVEKAGAKSYRGPMLRITIEHPDFPNRQFSAAPNHICFGSLRPNTVFRNKILMFVFGRYRSYDLTNYVYAAKDPDKFKKSNSLSGVEQIARQFSQANGGAEIVRFGKFTSWNDAFVFIPSTELEVGMEVPIVVTDEGETIAVEAEIKSITEEPYEGLVYALDVPEARNFAANGVLVHNSTLVQL